MASLLQGVINVERLLDLAEHENKVKYYMYI